MSHDEFIKINPELTEKLANAFIEKMHELGSEKMKEISWFNAKHFPPQGLI